MKQRMALMPLLSMLFAIVPVWAQQGPPPPGPVPVEFVLRAIDLTPAQRAQIEPLMRARHEAAEAAHPSAEAAGRALAEQVQAATFGEEAIRAAAADVAAFDADRLVADAALLRDIGVLIAPGQREKLDRLLMPPPIPAAMRPRR